jgi:OOP family OmpA-OmpF porin
MNTQNIVAGLAIAAGLLSAPVFAQDETTRPDNAVGDIAGRFYVSPMYSHTFANKDRDADDAEGGLFAIGKQMNPYANFEVYGSYNKYKSEFDDAKDGELTTAGLAVAGFPFAMGSNLLAGGYGLIGVNYADGSHFPLREGRYDQNRTGYVLDVGLGYLARLPFVRFASLRFDARYRMNFVNKPFASIEGRDTPNDEPNINDVVASVGLLIPIGSVPAPPAPPAPAVVPPVSICADGQDNDGDGLVDYPNDPGCTAADDLDETDPPQCSDGKDNDGDGQIDFPADKGCSAADDHDETDPCKTPEAGEKISLKGCGTGDVIVLRGVNFEFDKARLTPNAQSILDGVAAELKAYPEIQVELSGHTDALGSDAYNQRLSERRAASVKAYLVEAGIDGSRMTTVGHGESQPVADNQTEEGRELNRRTELKVTAGTAAVAPTTAEAPAADAAPSEPTALDAAPAETAP